jgi:hypothetical protein
VKPAALLALILFALPFASRADEDLVAKREACRKEARLRIRPDGKVGPDEYGRIVERRSTFVRQCMTRAAVAHHEAPLPPKKQLNETAEVQQKPIVSPAKKKPHRLAKRTERKKHKATVKKASKGKKGKAKRPSRSSRSRK